MIEALCADWFIVIDASPVVEPHRMLAELLFACQAVQEQYPYSNALWQNRDRGE